LAESVDLGVDDNLVVPAVAACGFWLAIRADAGVLTSPALGRAVLVGVAVSLVTGLLALGARGVDGRGLVVGVVIGTAVWAGTGSGGYLTLLSFFVLGTVATRIGYREKAARGIAEAYLAEGRIDEAIDFLAIAQDTQRLGELRAEAVSSGDAFRLRSVTHALGVTPEREEWSRLAEAARSLGKQRYADEAERQAERGED